MLLLLLILALVVSAVAVGNKHDTGVIGGCCVTVVVVGTLALLFGSVGLFDEQMSGRSLVVQHEAMQSTIDAARKRDDPIERAALITEIISINKSIASAKYWNETIFAGFVYDGAANLEPIH